MTKNIVVEVNQTQDILEGSANTDIVISYNNIDKVVVFTDLSLEKAIEYDDYCHNHKPPIPFIKSEVRGLFGNVFFDFGPGFTVFDVDDEEPRTGIIVSISNDNPALVSCVDDERLEFQDGDLVVFSEDKGMTELNDGKPRKVINAGPYSFFLEEDSTHFCAYDRGGIVMQVKQPKILHFKTLRDSLKDPGNFYLTDFSKYDRPPLLHLAFQALDKFRHDFGRFPVTESEEDVQRVIGLAVSINETSGDCKVKEVDEKLLRYFKTGSRAVLSPMAAMFGVIVGQEVVKACLGKSHPIVQFFDFDSIKSLPVELHKPEDLKPLNSCHDAQIISVLGLNLQKKPEQVIGFMAGAGALGCEFLKIFAIIGVCCSRIGKLTTTDDDVFEKSKLSRQFMFRDWNIGQSNSTVAATAASTINPALPVEALQNRVCPLPEDVFNDAFYERRDSVVNTLDSVNAKLYVECTFRSCSWNLEPWVPSVTPRWLYLT